MTIKIQIKSIFGDVLFGLEKENNTIRDTNGFDGTQFMVTEVAYDFFED